MTTSAQRTEMQPLSLRLLLACGAIGSLFFIAMFLIEGATRADYNPLRQPVSSLSVGEFGWMQIANFIISGLLILAFAIGLWLALRPSIVWGPLLLGLVGVGLIGAGIFVTDFLSGYLPGMPLMPAERTAQGRIHDLFSLPVFLGLPVACFVFGRQFARLGGRGWAIYSALSGIGMFVTFVPAGMGFMQSPGFAEFGGIFQRLSLAIGFGWITLLAIHLLRNSSSLRQRSHGVTN